MTVGAAMPRRSTYTVRDGSLIHRGEALCSGPDERLKEFAAVLRTARPIPDDIIPTVAALVRMTRILGGPLMVMENRSDIKPRVGPYKVRSNRLMYRDEELCAGPLLQLEWFRDALNACCPRDPDIGATLLNLIKMTRDVSFGPGERLLAAGEPIRLTRPQKPRKGAVP